MIEWTQPARLVTAAGTLDLNTAVGTGSRYLLDQGKCRVSRNLRVTSDPVPQGDGEIFHRRFSDGIEIAFSMRLWTDNHPACGSDARLMYEALALHLQAMLNDDGRFFWQPGEWGDERMMDAARWLAQTAILFGPNGEVTVEFSIDCPFPYFLDKTQREIALLDGVPTDVTLIGNADFFPVVHVDGPFTQFDLTNGATTESVFYDGGRPGATDVLVAHYAELDMYRMTIYEDGVGQSLKAGIDPELTDYFLLVPGVNTLTLNGADGSILVNDAWLP